jgi:2-C-methyl-D-erythritol 4-phosphate cytidylyltransferase/2-C-methyl-D-erythritol 2,4-cyclodiphosphate synthase
MAEPRFWAVIVAAGSSRRMDGLDKLEALVAGRPVLAWAVGAFAALEEVRGVVVVTAVDRVERYRAAIWLPERVSAVVPGGRRRQDSVAAGIGWLRANGADDPARDVVLVHDGARPAVSADLIRRVARATAEHGAAIAVVPVAETIKEVGDGVVIGTVDRARLAAAQTPQGVRVELLEAAWQRFPVASEQVWTDEAALLEACTIPVHVVAGEPENLKVTVPADLARADVILGGTSDLRLGIGSDTHTFGPGRPLALGGISLEDAPRLVGHSDGDVALHAVADALLGAAGLGDLGRVFPADARTPEGIASADLLRGVVARLASAGLRPRSVDLTIVGARPRLGGRLDAMRDEIAALLDIDRAAVSVKASTGNLTGPEGAGRALSAQAIAVVDARR